VSKNGAVSVSVEGHVIDGVEVPIFGVAKTIAATLIAARNGAEVVSISDRKGRA